MPTFRSRALTGSAEPRARAPVIRDVIEHRCSTCEQTYALARERGAIRPGTFYVLQGHLQVTCPEGHGELIETTIQHLW